jgi:hypothetical protein
MATQLTADTGVKHDPRFVGWLMITGKLDAYKQHVTENIIRYVSMSCDSLSFWGNSSHRITKIVKECRGPQAVTHVVQEALNNDDMQYVKVTKQRPVFNPQRFYVMTQQVKL